ncbi:FtsH protease activity modulator HflK [Rickettsia endosymbiont of Oedothorax gibbosus]|uniref:FtsH protease activity modulator HflK n=1 Tax=Rickettsia endosymbiont of Oedothorax gibbosus TaxID=931099 RepID=UPI00202473E3|nr:FtsH protease activity modulator HflK [Rickettsia endosymbiont of Oedothorax gibbosus]
MFNQILKKSPWGDSEEDEKSEYNIFTKPRKKNKFNFQGFFNKFGFNNNIMILVCLSLVAIWFASGVYEVKEGEEAAVMRFGQFVRKGSPGLNYHLPLPFEQVVVEKVNQSRRIEIGYRSANNLRSNIDNTKAITAESTMLTGDENIVALNCDVMWHISDLEKYIFNIVNPEESVKIVAESAIREVIGNTPISSILSDQKQEITNKIEALTREILVHYNAGVEIEKVQLLKAEPPIEVIDAYRDVQTSKADKEREINQALSYNNDILPKARGEAARILQEAEGYRQEVISKAEGDSKRFAAVYTQYVANKSITKDRLYLEAIEKILTDTSKVIMGTNGVLPHMAIQQNKIKE